MAKYFKEHFEAGDIQAMITEVRIVHYFDKAIHGTYLVWHVFALSRYFIKALLFVTFRILHEFPPTLFLLKLLIFLLCIDWVTRIIECILLMLSDKMI
jgi:hypothetical protein